ncbi:acid phosphatase/Vanadium-dependent haloperoxidase [Venturia nashicola]|uniref:Acid phosphatase/Vanadium-dependent haloperoxidase n=1 Tax=Venturia nashicola TaxID=86259 RepID=A0A4Z1NLF7_9PEZI|nr:acid phosphatase/Vanadium-dependent haloperoxidase [Venturia nashicola]
MRLSFWTASFATAATAAYSGDIVQYWVDRTAILVNGTIIGGLQSPPSAWVPAIVQGAQYLAATKSQTQSLAFQQLAVSVAAHNSLIWAFHGTRNYAATDAALKAVLGPIGLDPATTGKDAATIGKLAARAIISARSDDGANDFVDYVFGPKDPGVYQATPGGSPVPDTPEFRFVRLFAAVGNVSQFTVPDPPKVSDPAYEGYVAYVKAHGERNSSVRTPHDTDTAYFWRESSPTVWNRIANAVIGKSLATNVLASAKFYAQLNYALANAGIAGWNVKYKYNTWRPVTAIQRPGVWLVSGKDVSQPNWTPLLIPTPSHQDYVSTHSTFGGAASAVIRAYVKGDKINATVSSNVTLDNRGVITRTYTNLTEASIENGQSRVFGGLHFPFASQAGISLGNAVALATLKNFDAHWAEF